MTDIKSFHPYHLLHKALNYPLLDTIEEKPTPVQCSCCGYLTDKVQEKHMSGTFSDYGAFKARKNIPFLCPACAFGLKQIKKLHKMYLLTEKEMTFLQFEDRADKKEVPFGKKKIVPRSFLYETLLDPPKDNWILMVQSSMNPQHSLLHARVNGGKGDSVYVSDGLTSYEIPSDGLKELVEALSIAKKEGLFYYVFQDQGREPKDKKKKEIFESIAPIIEKHRDKHYFSFVYDRIVPPSKKGDK